MDVKYPGRDNYNFDGQDKSFAWLAALRGTAVDLVEVPTGRHNLLYIERAEPPTFLWLGHHILPPVRRWPLTPAAPTGTGLGAVCDLTFNILDTARDTARVSSR